QADDGIRDFHVTGVQTCALPILLLQVDQQTASSREPGPLRRRSREEAPTCASQPAHPPASTWPAAPWICIPCLFSCREGLRSTSPSLYSVPLNWCWGKIRRPAKLLRS